MVSILNFIRILIILFVFLTPHPLAESRCGPSTPADIRPVKFGQHADESQRRMAGFQQFYLHRSTFRRYKRSFLFKKDNKVRP